MSGLNSVPEILLVDKPYGFTSFDIIRIVRKQYQVKKVGHAGTLDPLATGLMLIGIDKGTKLLDSLTKLDKIYEVEILLGTKTDSGDLEGNIIETKKVEEISEPEIIASLKSCEGLLNLPVPRFSAVKVKGKKLYDKARSGDMNFETPKRDMQIYTLELLNHKETPNGYILNVKAHVGSGTYIRSLAEEIGERLGYPATVSNLRRTRIGDFDIEDAIKLDLNDEKGRIRPRSEREKK